MLDNRPTLPPEIARRRTFAIISHPDAGKTTLTEKFLLYGGAIQMAGQVRAKGEARRTRSDFMKMEQDRGISVSASAMSFDFKTFRFNLVDTPGHSDFSEDTYRTLTAVDSALMVIDCAKGVEERTIKLMEVCRLRDTPIMTFINKLDRDGRPPVELLDEIERGILADVVEQLVEFVTPEDDPDADPLARMVGIDPDAERPDDPALARLFPDAYADDDEAAEIWAKEIKLGPERIERMGESDNFWPASAPSQGPDGVCGPCSEIFFHPESGGNVEIWNLVFIQFNANADGSYSPLPAQHVDTGMGFERLVAVMQGKTSNYDTDVFQPLIERVKTLSGKPYEGEKGTECIQKTFGS